MCFTSVVMEQWGPFIPQPNWPNTTAPPTQIFTTPAPTPEPLTAEKLVELLLAFRKAWEAAETFDRLTGQPDCVDPEKALLLDRVAELERRLGEMEASGVAPQ